MNTYVQHIIGSTKSKLSQFMFDGFNHSKTYLSLQDASVIYYWYLVILNMFRLFQSFQQLILKCFQGHNGITSVSKLGVKQFIQVWNSQQKRRCVFISLVPKENIREVTLLTQLWHDSGKPNFWPIKFDSLILDI